jgi:hypothetical protein
MAVQVLFMVQLLPNASTEEAEKSSGWLALVN